MFATGANVEESTYMLEGNVSDILKLPEREAKECLLEDVNGQLFGDEAQD